MLESRCLIIMRIILNLLERPGVETFSFKSLSLVDAASLEVPFSEDGVKMVVWDIVIVAKVQV